MAVLKQCLEDENERGHEEPCGQSGDGDVPQGVIAVEPDSQARGQKAGKDSVLKAIPGGGMRAVLFWEYLAEAVGIK